MSTVARGLKGVGRRILPNRGSPNIDDVKRAIDEADGDATWTTMDTIAATGADQASRSVGRVADAGANTTQTAIRGGVGALGLGAGAYTGSKYIDYKDRVEEAQNIQEQRELLNEIRNDPSLSASEQENLISTIADESNALDSPWEQDSGGGDGLFPQLPSLFSTEGILLLLIVVYLGRTISRRMDK